MNRTKHICIYCGKQCKSGQSLGGHMVRCKNNPKLAQYTAQQRNTRTKVRTKYQLTCNLCGKSYVLNLTQNEYLAGKYRKHCSRSCANSHNVSQETKIKISNTLRKVNALTRFVPIQHSLMCLACNKQFNWIQKRKNSVIRMFCSRSCASKFSLKYIDHSKRLLQAYKHGKRVGGGYTKWIQYKGIKVQGTYQYRVCKILDYWVKTGNIKKWEYSPDRIEYTWQNGEVHYYIPDFKVFNFDGTEYYIQVKGYTKQLDERKWSQTKQRGYNLIVWFETNIIENESLIRD